MSHKLVVTHCSFQREKHGSHEKGLYIGDYEGDDNAVILDREKKVVPSIWDYHLWPGNGCAWFEFQEPQVKKG